MKREIPALLTAALFGLLASGADAHADSKQECAAAYQNTQLLRGRGQLRDARIRALACSASTCSVYVVKDCTQWLAEIEAILPTVVFNAVDAAGADTAAVRITVDGQVLDEQLHGKEVPMDPGEHLVRFELAGAPAIEQKLSLQQGEKKRAVTASFQQASPVAPPSASLPPPPVSPPRSAPLSPLLAAPAPPAPDSGGAPTWPWLTGAGGVVLLGVGAGFGVSALDAHSSLITKCGGNPSLCPVSTKSETVPLAEQRDLNRGVFLGLGAAGVLAIGAAVIGIVRGPAKAPSQRTSFVLLPVASPSGGGAQVFARF